MRGCKLKGEKSGPCSQDRIFIYLNLAHKKMSRNATLKFRENKKGFGSIVQRIKSQEKLELVKLDNYAKAWWHLASFYFAFSWVSEAA
jgi:retron-type reverse transcriptase